MHTLMNRNSHVLSRHGVNRPSPQVEIPVLQRFNVYQKGGAAHKHVIFAIVAQLVEHQTSTLRVAGSTPVSRSIAGTPASSKKG